MNGLLLPLFALVAFTYFGGQNVPKVLKDNKQMLLGIFVGSLLSFGGMVDISVEGLVPRAPVIPCIEETIQRQMIEGDCESLLWSASMSDDVRTYINDSIEEGDGVNCEETVLMMPTCGGKS